MSGTFGQYAEWYNAFNRDKDYAAEARYVLDLAQRWNPSPRRWLDLGCGSGNHLAALKALGLNVEGVDGSPTMIARARSRLPGVPLHVGSLQSLDVAGRHDVISMLFHVMSYQTSDEMIRRALDGVARHLAEGGVFVFDFWHSEAIAADPPTERIREVVVDGRRMVRVSRPTEDRAARRIDVKFEFRWDTPTGPVVHEEHHAMRHFSAGELRTSLQEAGLEVVTCEGWMRLRPLASSDWYGVICARGPA